MFLIGMLIATIRRPSVGTGPDFLQGDIPVPPAVPNIVASNNSIWENT